jgi:hypothetical protein
MCVDATYIEKAVFLLEHFDFDVVSCALQYFGDRKARENANKASKRALAAQQRATQTVQQAQN